MRASKVRLFISIVVVVFHVALSAVESAADGTTRPAADSIRVTPVVRAYRKASPAVVNISTQRLAQTGPRLFGRQDDPFEDFLSRFFRQSVPVVSLGSGILIHPDGYIVTNAHVVRRAQKITVTPTGGSNYAAEVVVADTTRDLAILRIRPDGGGGKKFPFLRLARSDDLMIGETVIAIGNPFGYQSTCTTGVISALDRKLEFRGGVVHRGLIQTDAPINPGNSGGPLLNIAGELIGINTAIRADAQGIGFAIPVDELTADLPRLLDFERINRVVFGLRVEQRRSKDRVQLVASSVAPGSPADKAGCKTGDRILNLNGKKLHHIQDYQVAMLSAKAGVTVRLRCERAGKKIDISVTSEAKPKPDGAALAWRLFGINLRPVTPEIAGRLKLPVEQGLLVVRVEQSGPAGRIGLRRGDVVFQLGKWYVKDTDQVGSALEDVRAGDVIRVGIVRGNVRAWTSMRARKSPASRPAGKKVRI